MAEAAQTYSYEVGDIEVIAVADGSRTAPVAEGFVINAPFEQVKASLNASGCRLTISIMKTRDSENLQLVHFL